MISGSPNGEDLEAEVVRDADQVRVKAVLELGGDQVAALLGAEDAMNEICGMCM